MKTEYIYVIYLISLFPHTLYQKFWVWPLETTKRTLMRKWLNCAMVRYLRARLEHRSNEANLLEAMNVLLSLTKEEKNQWIWRLQSRRQYEWLS